MGTVLVIGGGAAGLAAAIAAAGCGDSVTILERMDRIGKKILATGNGRCNLMNTGDRRFPGGAAMANAVLDQCGVGEQTRFWKHLGLRLRQEDGGRVYPVSGMASTVLDTLRFTLDGLGVQVVPEIRVTGLFKARHGWTVMAGEQKWKADRVIVAGGGCAQPKLGSDGSTWPLLTALGHTMIPAVPALSQIMTDTASIKGLSGIKIRTTVWITDESGEKARESGELLFADYGVTGVCVMQCARFAAPGTVLHMDLIKAMGCENEAEFRAELMRRRTMWGKSRSLSELLTGLCVAKLAQALLKAAGVREPHGISCADLQDAVIERIVRTAVDFSLTVKGVKGFDNAQVTAGGIAAEEFDSRTMESLYAPGVHAAGEILDVDGDCGGFNLMFAFGSGILAGLNGRRAPWDA